MHRPIIASLRLCYIISCAILLNVVLILVPLNPRSRVGITSVFLRSMLLICGIQLDCKIPLQELKRSGRQVLVANHVSYLDILIIASLRPCIFLAKKEVSNWPLFGWVARSLGCIFVHRESLMGRATALRRCLETFSNSDIALFPEGTTTASPLPELKSWAKGHAWLAQKAHADAILCIGLIYDNQADRAWTDDDSLIPHLFKTLSQSKTKIKVVGARVEVLPTLRPADLAVTTHQQLCMAVSHERLG